MPTYEYECRACGHSFERFQSIMDKAVRTGPSCRRRKVVRLPGTGAAILFKGSGFYETDYRSSDYKNAAKTEAKAAAGKSESDKGDKAGKSGKNEKKKDASGKTPVKPATSKKAKDG